MLVQGHHYPQHDSLLWGSSLQKAIYAAALGAAHPNHWYVLEESLTLHVTETKAQCNPVT